MCDILQPWLNKSQRQKKAREYISIGPLQRYMTVVCCTTLLVSYCRVHPVERIYNWDSMDLFISSLRLLFFLQFQPFRKTACHRVWQRHLASSCTLMLILIIKFQRSHIKWPWIHKDEWKGVLSEPPSGRVRQAVRLPQWLMKLNMKLKIVWKFIQSQNTFSR